jgi:hypothetical protein
MPNESKATKLNRLLIQKLLVAQLVKLYTSHRTWRFITMFTRAYHWNYSEADEPNPHSYSHSIRSILMLYTHLCLYISMVFSLLAYWEESCMHFIASVHATCPPYSIFHLITLIIFHEDHESQSPSLYNSLCFPLTSSPLGPNIPPCPCCSQMPSVVLFPYKNQVPDLH